MDTPAATDEFPLEALPAELKVAIFIHLPSLDLARSIARVSREWRQLARAAFTRRGTDALDQVVLVQRWWRAKREAAFAHELHRRVEAFEMAIDTAKRIVAPKRTCLELRRLLLDLIAQDEEDGQPKMKSWSAPSSFFGGVVSAILARPRKNQAGVRFTRELVEALLPEQLLLDLIAPFERFIADANVALRAAKQDTAISNNKKKEKEVDDEGEEDEEAASETEAGQRQAFAALLTRLLNESISPIGAYLTHLRTERVRERITSLCKDADLEGDARYWTLLSQHFASPLPLIAAIPDQLLDFVDDPSYGYVYPASERAKATRTGINTFGFVFAIGWGSIIVRVSMAINQLVADTVPPHPDRRNLAQLARQMQVFLKLLDIASSNTPLCYD